MKIFCLILITISCVFGLTCEEEKSDKCEEEGLYCCFDGLEENCCDETEYVYHFTEEYSVKSKSSVNCQNFFIFVVIIFWTWINTIFP